MATNTQKTQEIKVPVLPESVQDATIATWYKKPGEGIKRDEKMVDIETDKVVLEVVAPFDGNIETILKPQGSIVNAQEVIAVFKAGDINNIFQTPKEEKPLKQETQEKQLKQEQPLKQSTSVNSPSARRKMAETAGSQPFIPTPAPPTSIQEFPMQTGKETLSGTDRIERRVPMSRLRARVAERLVQAQQTAAILTTFNEINMQAVMELRKKYKELFEKKQGTRLGLMSFFVAATVI